MEHGVRAAVKKAIADHALIEKGMRVVAGLSGGPDSVCLFHVLASLREELGFDLAAVHVNHGLRPGAAERDARFAEAFCRALGAPFFGFERDVRALARARGIGEEEAGRAVRYEAFREAAARTAAENALPPARVRIAVAHNKNDQAETVLMRILRGTGPDGLAAMPHLREDEGGFAVIRPLLDVPRARIEAYCAAEGLAPARDRSNEESVYTRNRIRLSLLPLLEKDYNENIVEALARLAANAAEDRAYFDEITNEMLENGRFAADGAFEMPLAPFTGARAALRHRLIVRCFERAGLTRDIAAVHLRAADALIAGGRTGKSVDFPNGYRLSLRYGRLRFRAAKAAPSGPVLRECALSLDALTRLSSFAPDIGVGTVRFSLHPAPRAGDAPAPATPAKDGEPAPRRSPAARVELDFDLLAAAHGDIGVRRRRAGDWTRPAGMDGTKRLQDLFVDAKLPREERDFVPLIAAGDEILCLLALATGCFYRKTGNYAVTDATRRVLRIDYCFLEDETPRGNAESDMSPRSQDF